MMSPTPLEMKIEKMNTLVEKLTHREINHSLPIQHQLEIQLW